MTKKDKMEIEKLINESKENIKETNEVIEKTKQLFYL